jgi:hypothetical protein
MNFIFTKQEKQKHVKIAVYLTFGRPTLEDFQFRFEKPPK